MELKNFRNFAEEKIDFEDSSVWILRGKNSSGKSTLACDALTYGLFGKIQAMDEPADLRILKDDVIRRGKRKAYVRIDFSHKGDIYKLTRTREKAKSSSKETVTIIRNDNYILVDAKKSEADNWIQKNLWTYDDFTNTTLILQNDMTKALEMVKGDRKDYLERLFNIKNFEKMSERARDKSRNLDAKISEKSGGITTDQEKIIDIEVLNVKKLEYQKKLDTVTNEFTLTKKNLEKVNAEKKVLDGLFNDFTNLKNEKKSLSNEIDDLKKDISGINIELKGINNIIYGKKEVEQVIIQIEKLEEKIKEFAVIKDELKHMQNEKDEWNDSIEKAKKQLETDLNAYKIQLEEKKEINLAQENRLQELQKQKEEINRLNVKVQKLPEKKAEFEEAKKRNQRYQTLTSEFSAKESELKTKINSATQAMKERKKIIKSLPIINQQLKLKEKYKADLAKKETENKHVSKEIKLIEKKINKQENSIQVLNTKIANHRQNISELGEEKEKIKELRGGAVCPKCNQQVSGKHLEDLIKKINVSIKENMVNIDAITDELELIGLSIVKLNEQKNRELRLQEDLEGKIIGLRKGSDGIAATRKELEHITQVQEEHREIQEKGGLNNLFIDLRKNIQKIEELRQNNFVDPVQLQKLEKNYINLEKDANSVKLYRENIKKIPELENTIEKTRISIQNEEKVYNQKETSIKTNQFALKERKEVKLIQTRITERNELLQEETKINQELSELNPKETRKRKKKIEEKERKKIEVSTQLKEKDKQIKKTSGKYEGVLKSLEKEKFKNQSIKIDENLKEFKLVEKQFNEINISKINAHRDLEEHNKKIAEQMKLLESIHKRERSILKIREQQDVFNELSRIFKHIGGRILSRLRNRINLETVNILNLLGNPQLHAISLEEDYSLSIQTPEGDERPGFFSGGQRVRIGLAFRLALSNVLAEFRGNELDTLIIDEGGFGALDQEGQEGVIEVFNAIQDRFQRMIIISHIEAIADNLPGISLFIENGSIINTA